MAAAIILVAVFVIITAVYFSTVKGKRVPKGLRKVPGPTGIPILGNTHQLKPQPQRQFQQWAREYGELFQIQMGWENWVFINSPAAVKELLDKQSAATSGRVPAPVLQDLVSGGMRFLLMQNNSSWRKLRAIVHKILTPKASEGFKPSQEFEAKQLLRDILESKDDASFYMHVRRYSTSVVMTSTYGKRVPKWECEDVREIYAIMAEFSIAAAPGAFLADMIPPLARIPVWMQWWRRRALQYRDRQTRLWTKYWNNLKQQMAEKRAPECFVKDVIEDDYEKQGISELQAAYVAGSMIEAGSETTSSSLNSCILYLAANPQVQARANEEITRIIGDSRSPTFADEPQLPYIRAMVKEILRIRPVTTIGTPHYSTADVVYKDYFIPAGTVLSLQQYAIHFDPKLYTDPEAFKPERFLYHPLKAGAYAGLGDPYARDHFDFGAGRRICPGMHLAENSLFITLAKILWAFEIRPPLGPGGEEQVVDTGDAAYEDGGNTIPKPFRVRFLVRNAERERIVGEEWRRAVTDGYYLGKAKVDAAGVVVAA